MSAEYEIWPSVFPLSAGDFLHCPLPRSRAVLSHRAWGPVGTCALTCIWHTYVSSGLMIWIIRLFRTNALTKQTPPLCLLPSSDGGATFMSARRQVVPCCHYAQCEQRSGLGPGQAGTVLALFTQGCSILLLCIERCILLILKDKSYREKVSFHLLVHPPNVFHSQSWVRLKPGACIP